MAKVVLRPLSREDSGNIVRWRNREFVRSNLYSQELLTEQLQQQYFDSHIATGQIRQYVIAAADGHGEKDIGTVFFKPVMADACCAELGILLGEKAFLGGGYGFAALQAALKLAFTELCLQRVYARIKKSNAASCALFAKCGFQTSAVDPKLIFDEEVTGDTLVVELAGQ